MTNLNQTTPVAETTTVQTITSNGQPRPQDPGAIPERESECFLEAQKILRGQTATPQRMLELAVALQREMRFSYARRLLTRASNHESVNSDLDLREKIFQKLALSTYKDEDLPVDDRLDRALATLQKIAVFKTTTNQETLGLLGAIHKRKWEVDTQRKHLERSLDYYMRGYKVGVRTDQGYNGINAAFVLDLLASLEEGEAENSSESSPIVDERRKKAQEIRGDIDTQVSRLVEETDHQWVAAKWWYYATIAEANFGLRNYARAVEWINKGRAAVEKVYEWELETCARQLATIARLQLGRNLEDTDLESTPAWLALREAFGTDAVPRTAFAGKIGLALSGGGFRASLYHLGVLAKLAELDILRNVEVLSCVSGGSIVGAYYYLKVRQLLQNQTDSTITREDYLRLVHETIEEFVAGVKKNIRTRVALNPLKNFRMYWSEEYSRTTRAAELFEKHLYALVKDGQESQERWLNKLAIKPLTQDGSDTRFAPKYQNWRRNAKVPILVLNAATLNTGHTWQFTASWMGESPAGIDSEIDGNDRLRRMYYGEAPADHKQVRLGRAVGASAAVPGVFEPLTMNELYPDRIVRLVDGGVTDNQGVATLLEQDCKVILVSDASGQMESQLAVGRGILGVLLRTNNIFQARIRTAQYHDLKGRRRSNLLRGFMFVHLKGDLEVDPVDWIDCLDPYIASDDSRPPSRRGRLTSYGIAKDIQQLLSALRTDLDSFSEAEAYALMTSAYRMTEQQISSKKCVEGFPEPKKKPDWEFLEIENCMTGEGNGYEYLKKLLSAGSSLAFKVWKIDPILKNLARIILALLIIGILFAGYNWWTEPLPTAISQQGTTILEGWATWLRELTIQKVATAIGSMVGVAVGFYLLTKLLTALLGTFVAENAVMLVRWKDFVKRVAVATFVSTIGFVAALLHLSIFDRRFLRLSSLERVKKKCG
jgi:predicted acylesterase/phospholipase RssA